ncbi:hypothetical protein ASG89_05545 [Paenibacillus sp. Soil766]|nr:hypothetical protein ASG89_05545 [Paenibacillus sp. Soil766]
MEKSGKHAESVSMGLFGHAELIEKFTNPPIEHRSIPFWSWNGRLEQEELNTQVEGFKEQGMGGFMMHVREGLETPYMGQEFMERIKDTVAKAKAEGVSAWLYDEDRYSSGMGGGMVPRIGGDAVRAKALALTICRSFEPDESIQAVYQAIINGNELVSCVRLTDFHAGCSTLNGEDVYLVMRRLIASPNDWCHGDTYTDTMNPESARIFIETTYERYKEAVGEEFGHTIPGIFTDEPFILGFRENLNEPEWTWIAWSQYMPQTFADKNGYEIWDTLPYFFFHGEPSSKIRYDYWKTVTDMFCEAYTKQIGDWCRANGISFTGHYCCEEDVVEAARYGGAVMPHYRYMDIPGIDTLCEQTNESLSIKEVSSVAHQYGKKKVITETYGVTGWALSFEGRKWIGDWQFVLGVNVLTHHLALYTLRGCRKRDYPPSFNYNVNWWEHNHVMEDYFARLGSVLSEGDVVRDVLVIHPTASVWAKLGKDVQATQWRNQGGNSEELSQYSLAFNNFIRQLLGEHYDFDLGDELILEEDGSIEGEQLRVGEATYRVVVLPSLSNLLRSTYKLLLDYLNAGGHLFSFGDVPVMLEGEVSEELQLLTGHPRFKQLQSRHYLAVEIEAIVPRTVSLLDRNGREDDRLLYMRRELKDCTIVFVVNNDREAAHDVEVRILGGGRVEEWNLLSGQRVEKTAVQARNGYVVMQESFGLTDSKLYVISHHDELSSVGQQSQGKLEPLTALGPIASFSRTALNALVLDRCQYQLQDETWSPSMDVWQAQRELREKLKMRQIYMNSNYQRYLWIHEPHENDGTPVTFRWVFSVKDIPTTDTFLACEQGERFRFRLNGHLLTEVPSGWYLDRCMSTLKLPALIEGENVLEILCAYTHDMEIENVFLLGDFAIDYNRCLIKEPNKLRFGDWCLQGYPHYCGSMVYHFDLDIGETDSKRTFLEIGPYEAVTLNLKVNGKQERSIPWRSAGTVDLTDDLVKGMNRIDIEVVGSPRNLLGPLHEIRTNQAWTDWWSYHSSGKEYTQEYNLHPYGLLGQIHMYQMDN